MKEAFEKFDSHLEEIEKKGKEERKEILARGIEKLEKDKQLLKSSRAITNRILDVREQAGISTAVGTSGKIKSPRLLGKKDFETLLQRELLIIGTEELKTAGGAISLSRLYSYFEKTRPNWKIKKKEIKNAVENMEKVGIIPGIIKNDKEEIVLFRPLELDSSIKKVLIAASGGITKINDLANLLGWDIEVVKQIIIDLEKQGICVIDNNEVFFPGLINT